MTRTIVTLMFTAALAACGSKPAAPATLPAAEPAAAGTGSADLHDVAPPSHAASPAEPAPAPSPDPAADVGALRAAETAAWESARPSFQKYCAACHTRTGKKAAKKKLDHFTMDSYPPGGHHTATIGTTIRDVLGLSGKKPTMPFDQPGSVAADDLASIKAWTDAWQAAEAGGAHTADNAHHH